MPSLTNFCTILVLEADGFKPWQLPLQDADLITPAYRRVQRSGHRWFLKPSAWRNETPGIWRAYDTTLSGENDAIDPVKVFNDEDAAVMFCLHMEARDG